MAEVDNIFYIEEDKQTIRKWASKPKIADIIIDSVAPSIHGHKDVKTGIALALFGGVAKDIQGKHRLRGGNRGNRLAHARGMWYEVGRWAGGMRYQGRYGTKEMWYLENSSPCRF